MGAWQERVGIIRGLFHETSWEAARPVLRLGLRCGIQALTGGLLAGAAWSAQPLFLAVGAVAAGGGGLMGLAALVGTILGSVVLWGPLGALEQVAAALLCFCICFVLRDLRAARSHWLGPVVAAGTALLLGAVALWAGELRFSAAALTILRAALAALTAAALPREDQIGRSFGVGALVLGGAAVTLPMNLNLGGLLAAWWTAAAALERRPGPASAVALAAGAALSLHSGGPWPLALGAACLAVRAAAREKAVFRAALYLLTALSAMFLLGGPVLSAAVEITVGTLLGALTPVRKPVTQSARQQQLRLAAEGLRALDRCVEQRESDNALDTAALLDRTTEQVCRICGSFNECWEQRSSKTIAALAQLPEPVLERGHVRREELPAAFLDCCRRPEAFTAALNHQLELRLCRRQGSVRLAELRTIQAKHSAVMTRLLERLAAPETAPPVCRYRVSMGAAAAARNGELVSGDAGSYCKGPDGWVYLLVCDGMGTGAEAARLSHAAVDALSALLQAGTAPEDALVLLGNSYLLRGDGAFSTVDLAAVDLRSGNAVIYKWGAAPSYLLTADGVKRVGTATVPPGLSADEALAAETVRLSLGRGEMLVLISDGAGGTETERLLGAYDGCAPRELADRVIRAAQSRAAADDMTAAALRLERVQ